MTARRAFARRRDRRAAFWRAFYAWSPPEGEWKSSRAFQAQHPAWADVRVRRHVVFSPVFRWAMRMKFDGTP